MSLVASALRQWPLLLLAITSVALSLASGWTTWDGMSNFTREPVLSFLITFGIQAVMLVTAWLIGERLANRPVRSDGAGPAEPSPKAAASAQHPSTAVTVMVVAGAASLALSAMIGIAVAGAVVGSVIASGPALVAMGALAVLVAVLYVRKRGLRAPVARLRRSMRNIMLWFMFVTCMGVSVFFSFDSLFAVVFPEQERTRAAVVRAQSSADKVLSEIERRSATEMAAERAKLLEGNSWKAYSAYLALLRDAVAAANQAGRQASEATSQKLRDAEAERVQERARLVTALSSVSLRLKSMTDGISEKRQKVSALMQRDSGLREKLSEAAAAIAAKESEAKAEEQGVSASKLIGRGPRYREDILELRRLQLVLELTNKEAQTNAANITVMRTEVAKFESEQAAMAGEAAKLESQIATLDGQDQGQIAGLSVVNAAVEREVQLTAIEEARIAFERAPDKQTLQGLQDQCTRLVSDLVGDGVFTVALTDCNPTAVYASGVTLFAVASGRAELERDCIVTGSTLDGSDRVDAAISKARHCLQSARLSEAASAELRADIKAIETYRDDKSHRFIVTTNAFLDGNRLAYLALVLAIGIDGLVFVSGLLGALSLRSPFASLPEVADRPLRWADRIMESALLPDTLAMSRRALELIEAVEKYRADEMSADWSHIISMHTAPASVVNDLRRIVNAASIIGAARRRPMAGEIYELRAELVEFLSAAAQFPAAGAMIVQESTSDRDVVIAALQPDPVESVSRIHAALQPSQERIGYPCEIDLSAVDRESTTAVKRFLNAAAIVGGVQRVGNAQIGDRYLIRKDVCVALQLFGTRTHEGEPHRRDTANPVSMHRTQFTPQAAAPHTSVHDANDLNVKAREWSDTHIERRLKRAAVGRIGSVALPASQSTVATEASGSDQLLPWRPKQNTAQVRAIGAAAKARDRKSSIAKAPYRASVLEANLTGDTNAGALKVADPGVAPSGDSAASPGPKPTATRPATPRVSGDTIHFD